MEIGISDINDFFEYQGNKDYPDNIFVSENDLVLGFALFIYNKYPKAKIRFEYPFEIIFEPQDKKWLFGKSLNSSYLDLLVTLDNIKYGFEFKYHTSFLKIEKLHQNFELKDHIARDVLNFMFRKDIYRLSYLKNNMLESNTSIDKGFGILLTNDLSLINNNVGTDTLDKNYRFNETEDGKMKGEDVSWNPKKENWQCPQNQNLKLPLRKSGYHIKWEDYIKLGTKNNEIFKYCVVEV